MVTVTSDGAPGSIDGEELLQFNSEASLSDNFVSFLNEIIESWGERAFQRFLADTEVRPST